MQGCVVLHDTLLVVEEEPFILDDLKVVFDEKYRPLAPLRGDRTLEIIEVAADRTIVFSRYR